VGESPENAVWDFVFARSRSGSSALPFEEGAGTARSSISSVEST
jgi:hypothetical protein